MAGYVVQPREDTRGRLQALLRGSGFRSWRYTESRRCRKASRFKGPSFFWFPTFEEARQWHLSSAYRGVAAHRHNGAKYRGFIVESCN
ncbi:DUF1330 domain-containing protein [Paraburkholderia sp. GAS334]|uniref:DUF1330 domain-containing protein n=1 Tax=Paraburkholderia sp. GAS334 TaxID=3035131 RepID=UPI003D1F0927